ncbi:hypothetical protein Droror1_Dr00010925 [Drosera rotundifolia]
MEKSEGNAVGEGRAVVDAQAPFRSVKEAVMLFGEKVLVGEIYANRLKEMQAQAIEANLNSKLGAVTTELNEEKKSLRVAREEANDMAYNLESLKEELHQTRRELQQLKAKAKKDNEKRAINVEIDQQLKFVGNSAGENATEFQVKKLVRFASPGSLAPRIEDKATYMIEGQGKKKKKGFHVLGWIFTRKRGGDGDP